MRLFLSTLANKSEGPEQGMFEKIFLNNDNYISSTCNISNGKLTVYDWFDDRVILTNYETSTQDDTGEFIQFGRASLRESSGVGNVGTHIIYLTTETVIPFAFKPAPTTNEWIPYHGIKTTFAVSGTRALIYIDGVPYDIYGSLTPAIEFTEITIDQHIWGQVTPDGVPIDNPDRADGCIELTSKMTITPQQLIMEQSFVITEELNWAIGYSPMWSVDGNAMKYYLLQNGNKFLVPLGDGSQDFNDDIYEVGYNSDENYGSAFITTQADGTWWTDGTPCYRWLQKTQGGAKQKMYYEMLRSHTIPLGSTYINNTKYIWGRADGFMDIYNNAPIENP